MKSPKNQRPDDEAREDTDDVHRQVRRQGRPEVQAEGPHRAEEGRREEARREADRREGVAALADRFGDGPPTGGPSSFRRPVSYPPLRVSDRFSIAQVTPYAWERAHEVNTHVREVSAELAARGHRVLIVAPSSSPQLVREGRRG